MFSKNNKVNSRKMTSSRDEPMPMTPPEKNSTIMSVTTNEGISSSGHQGTDHDTLTFNFHTPIREHCDSFYRNFESPPMLHKPGKAATSTLCHGPDDLPSFLSLQGSLLEPIFTVHSTARARTSTSSNSGQKIQEDVLCDRRRTSGDLDPEHERIVSSFGCHETRSDPLAVLESLLFADDRPSVAQRTSGIMNPSRGVAQTTFRHDDLNCNTLDESLLIAPEVIEQLRFDDDFFVDPMMDTEEHKAASSAAEVFRRRLKNTTFDSRFKPRDGPAPTTKRLSFNAQSA